ncbi:MAG: MerR family transcriptional regulator [Lachnospiraceae bacterium]|nr:MerR family transcriptional regulator [Lachnospiraceae bacterium]
MNDLRYMISDASKKLQVEAHVLRYWEDELGMEIPRTELGHRYYTEEHLLIFERIKLLKEAGYLLKAIKLIMPKLGSLDEDEFEFIALVAEEMNRMAAETTAEEAAAADSGDVSHLSASEFTAASVTDIPEQSLPGRSIPEQSISERPISERSIPERSTSEQSIPERSVSTQGADTRLYSSASDPEAENAVIRSAGQSPFSVSDVPSELSASGTALADAQLPSNVIPINRTPAELTHEEKMQQFQTVMTAAMAGAMQSQAQQFTALLSEQLGGKLLTEINYLLRLRQEQDELHFQQLDETIRSHQKAMQEAAASRATGRRKKRK